MDTNPNNSPRQDELRRLEQKFWRRRVSFRHIAILSYFNLALIAIGADISFPFSAFSPAIPLVVGMSYGGTAFSWQGTVGLIVGAAMVSLLLLLFVLSKKSRWPAAVGLALMLADTVVVMFFSFLGGGFDPMFLVDIGFHVWAIVELVRLFRSQGDYFRARDSVEIEGEYHI